MNNKKQSKLFSEGEEIVIEIIRKFDFLKRYYYKICDLATYGREIYVCYSSAIAKREVHVTLYDTMDLVVQVVKMSSFLSKEDTKNIYEIASKKNVVIPTSEKEYSYKEILHANADFMKNELEDILKGKSWF